MTNQLNQRKKTIDIVYIGIFSAIIAICAWISIPATVPFTLQTMGIFAAVGILGGKRGSIAVLIYIVLGAIGLPVFAGFSGGIGVIFGTTGGYILGFVFSALFMWFIEKIFGNNIIILAISMIFGIAICYFFGTIWFIGVYTKNFGYIDFSKVLSMCVIPFIIPDLIKIALSLLLTKRLKKFIK